MAGENVATIALTEPVARMKGTPPPPPPEGVDHVLSPRRKVVELGVPVAVKSAMAIPDEVTVCVLPAK
jgi:hypothetical protein